MGVDRGAFLKGVATGPDTFFHLERFPPAVEIHHPFFLLELVFHLAHLFLDVRVSRGDGQAFLDHPNTKD